MTCGLGGGTGFLFPFLFRGREGLAGRAVGRARHLCHLYRHSWRGLLYGVHGVSVLVGFIALTQEAALHLRAPRLQDLHLYALDGLRAPRDLDAAGRRDLVEIASKPVLHKQPDAKLGTVLQSTRKSEHIRSQFPHLHEDFAILKGSCVVIKWNDD